MTKLNGLSRPSGSRRGGRGGVHLETLLGGFLGGAFVMYILMIPLAQVTNSTDKTSPSNQLRRMEQQPLSPTTATSPGWHPIHVFFGDESGLNISPGDQWFAQVHQDEIVLDLIGENGFFLDLAANDAKEYSNTLALEKHGWNGVCVEPNPGYWYGLSHRKVCFVKESSCRLLLLDNQLGHVKVLPIRSAHLTPAILHFNSLPSVYGRGSSRIRQDCKSQCEIPRSVWRHCGENGRKVGQSQTRAQSADRDKVHSTIDRCAQPIPSTEDN